MLGGSIYFIYWIKKTINSIFCIIEQQQNQSKIMLSIQNELVDNYTYCKKYADKYNIFNVSNCHGTLVVPDIFPAFLYTND